MSSPSQPFFPFELGYLVGIEALDSQHKQIVTLLNEVYESIVAKKPRHAHIELLTRLVSVTKTHFATEEHALRTRSCPGYLRHKAAHEGLARNLVEYQGQVATRERELTLEYADLMKFWLMDHFAEFDMGYKKFLEGENHPAGKDSSVVQGQ